jgi:hypothetical protein
MKFFYKCRQHDNCPVTCQIFFSASSSDVLYLVSNESHSTQVKCPKNKLPENSTKFIQEQTKRINLAPLQLKSLLLSENLPLMTTKQIANFKRRTKEKSTERLTSFSELAYFCQARTALPEDKHKFFVSNHTVDENGSRLFIFFSTPALLRLVRQRPEIIHIDATHKLNWEGFPCVIPCISDTANQGHPLGIVVLGQENEAHFKLLFEGLKQSFWDYVDNFAWNPRVLVKDCCFAISNAFFSVFGRQEKKIVDCWFHVSQNLQQRLKTLDETTSNALKKDIWFLQGLPTQIAFENGMQLFLDKWRTHSSAVIAFIDYFQSNYVRKFPNWNEGYAPGFPSTNNAQESLNNL